jgi:predicted alpha/beta superfamily hydrolase
MKPFKIVFLFAIFSIVFQLDAQEDKIALMVQKYKLKNFLGAEDERYLTSKETNSTYKISIYLPLTYGDTNLQYPVMVLTDASYTMGIAQTTFDYMTISLEVPEVIIIGIDYPYSNLLEYARKRFGDMLPTHVEGYNPSGSADKFIAFIKKELFPYIEDNYRIDTTDKCFFGHSFGGLLGSHILIEQPQLFNRYILGSPSYWWDNKEITQRLSRKVDIMSDSVKTVYTYIGGKEGVHITNWKEFNGILANKISRNIKFHNQIFQDESHTSVIPAAFSTAIKFVYKK